MLTLRSIVTAVAVAAAFLAGVQVEAWRAAGPLEQARADLAREQRDRKAENAQREAQARRAIDTARQQESETRDKYEAIHADLDAARAAHADALAAAEQRRLRDIAAARAATAARGGRLPETAPAAAGSSTGPVDPIGFLLAIRGEDEADARLADDVADQLRACYARARADREMRPP